MQETPYLAQAKKAAVLNMFSEISTQPHISSQCRQIIIDFTRTKDKRMLKNIQFSQQINAKVNTRFFSSATNNSPNDLCFNQPTEFTNARYK